MLYGLFYNDKQYTNTFTYHSNCKNNGNINTKTLDLNQHDRCPLFPSMVRKLSAHFQQRHIFCICILRQSGKQCQDLSNTVSLTDYLVL